MKNSRKNRKDSQKLVVTNDQGNKVLENSSDQPVESTPVESTPVEEIKVLNFKNEKVTLDQAIEEINLPARSPVESTPVESTPVESTPVESTPVESTPVESTPVESTPPVLSEQDEIKAIEQTIESVINSDSDQPVTQAQFASITEQLNNLIKLQEIKVAVDAKTRDESKRHNKQFTNTFTSEFNTNFDKLGIKISQNTGYDLALRLSARECGVTYAQFTEISDKLHAEKKNRLWCIDDLFELRLIISQDMRVARQIRLKDRIMRMHGYCIKKINTINEIEIFKLYHLKSKKFITIK